MPAFLFTAFSFLRPYYSPCMKILLTGATGFIGKKLGLALVQAGHEIHAIVRDPKKASLELPFPCEISSWKEASQRLENIDAVIHLAGESIAEKRWTKAQKQKLISSRIDSAKQLAALLREIDGRQPKVFISASAVGFYGDRGDELLTEEAKSGEDFLAELCRAWEAGLFRLTQMRTVALRIGAVLGRDGGALQKMLPIFKAGLGARLGGGKQWMSWIHVDDLVRLFQFCLENEQALGPINAVAPMPVTNAEFTKKLCKSLGVWENFPVPSLVLKLLLGEMSMIVLKGQKVSSQKAQELGFRFSTPSLPQAFSAIFGSVEQKRSAFTEEFSAAQWVPFSREEIFPFFADAKNLERITPPLLQFTILSQSTEKIQAGSEFTYRLKIHGIPVTWKTHILEWNPCESFVDNQEWGPYKLWHHTHNFLPLGEGTFMHDRVQYQLPLGWLGYVLGGWKVRKDIAQIFAYRQKVIDEKYPRK